MTLLNLIALLYADKTLSKVYTINLSVIDFKRKCYNKMASQEEFQENPYKKKAFLGYFDQDNPNKLYLKPKFGINSLTWVLGQIKEENDTKLYLKISVCRALRGQIGFWVINAIFALATLAILVNIIGKVELFEIIKLLFILFGGHCLFMLKLLHSVYKEIKRFYKMFFKDFELNEFEIKQ